MHAPMQVRGWDQHELEQLVQVQPQEYYHQERFVAGAISRSNG